MRNNVILVQCSLNIEPIKETQITYMIVLLTFMRTNLIRGHFWKVMTIIEISNYVFISLYPSIHFLFFPK